MLIYYLLSLIPNKIQMPLQGVPLIDRDMNVETEVHRRKELSVVLPHPLR